MPYGLYAIKDAKNGFMFPQTDANDETAIRNFSNALMDKDSMLVRFASDFTLWKVGEFNSETGEVFPIMVQLVDAASIVYGRKEN